MPLVKIDGKEYDVDAMSPDAKAQLQSLQYVDVELNRLNAQLSIYKTARLSYARALTLALQPSSDPAGALFVGDTIKLS